MVRNLNSYKEHVKVCHKEATYKREMRILCQGRNNNPAHKDASNSFISELKKKNPRWDKKPVDDRGSNARTLFTVENSVGDKFQDDLYEKHLLIEVNTATIFNK